MSQQRNKGKYEKAERGNDRKRTSTTTNKQNEQKEEAVALCLVSSLQHL